MADEILTVEAVAALLHLHPDTVRDKAASGSLPGFKAGRRWLFRRDVLMAEMDARTAPRPSNETPKQEPSRVAMPAPHQPVRIAADAPRIVLFPEAPWRTEEERRTLAASSAAARGRTPKTKKTALSGH